MKEKLLLIHGGGPTAVMNGSLCGAVVQAQKLGVRQIVAAKGGLGGALRREWLDLTRLSDSTREALLLTPGSAIGTSREPVSENDYAKIVEILKSEGFTHVLLNGGNGTMNACSHLASLCEPCGIAVAGIPKTMDNDLQHTDHCPGYGSAARYMAVSIAELCADLRSLPIHLVVVEALGRNAGWVTAASALAADISDGPDLIYLPETPFDEESFLSSAQNLIDRKHSGLIVVSEGLRKSNGEPVTPLLFHAGRSEYFGDVSAYLAQKIVKELGYKARSEKPGLLGRASVSLRSSVDLQEAIDAGSHACEWALQGQSDIMVSFTRTPEGTEMRPVSLRDMTLGERTLPPEYRREHSVSLDFLDWLRPLVGPLPRRMGTLF